uniref:J domain-containing protein n=1 Tax=Opuntia streptacantha TaxID=393608 RepID=A0A7C9EBL8_OPUST
MAGGGERKSSDFYSVLGLEKECTPTELRNAYKKLAMRWHPDRCSASGNSKSMEEAKKNFQDIQEAYSVLSDETRRFLYDVGVYDKEDDENNNGMGDFLNEMVDIMKESKPNESAEESFEQLQDLFNEMFPKSVHQASMSFSQGSTSTLSRSSSNMGSIGTSFISNSCKRSSSEMNNPEGSSSSSYDAYFQNILPGADQSGGDPGRGEEPRGTRGGDSAAGSNSGSSSSNGRRRQGRKQKISSGHDVSSNNYPDVST